MKSVKSINPFKSVIQTSYDIVKAHGREIKEESKEGEGTEFTISLPETKKCKNAKLYSNEIPNYILFVANRRCTLYCTNRPAC
jgi:hypothetical protein